MARCEVNYDNLHEFYNSRYKTDYLETCEALELMRVKDILKEVPIHVSTILDYGCGRGRWINLLLDIFPNAEITGVDISDGAIKKAEEIFPSYRFYSFDGETAPFDNDSFDLIFCYHVLEHVYDFKKNIQDLCRLVKKKGYICVILPCGNEGSFEERVVGLIRGGKEKSIKDEIRFFYEDSGHFRRMKSEEVIKSFKINNVSLQKDFYGDQLWGAIYWQ